MAHCKLETAVATVIPSDIKHLLSNNNSTVNQWSHWKPLQRLIISPGYIHPQKQLSQRLKLHH